MKNKMRLLIIITIFAFTCSYVSPAETVYECIQGITTGCESEDDGEAEDLCSIYISRIAACIASKACALMINPYER